MPTNRPSSPPTILIATLLASLFVGGCATSGARDAAVSDRAPVADVFHTVQRGDRLADIAHELTGDASLWTEIAASNGIEDPRALQVGAVLRIPAALIPEHADEFAVASAELEPGAERRTLPATTPGLALGRPAPVRLSVVDVNRRFELAPLERGGMRTDTAAASDAEAAPHRIRVVGSYTPKGIYSQPAIYSALLMRVAPGTLLELERKVGDWYGVVTEQGVGYLRDSDGRLLDDEAEARRRSPSPDGARG